jgi:molybdopterin/thiamine biosynthesis adenylyltransferase/rhodanese-related sulfurtransferase
MSADQSYERYQRQMLLPGFGKAAQQKLWDAKVLVVGAGGLGCPILQYLAAAGVGTIGIIDYDNVTLDNLHRQILYAVNDIGSSKAERAGHILQQMNPDCRMVIYTEQLTNKNALLLLNQFDIIVDGTDNFSTRYMINDACVLLRKPLVYGAISQFEGQVSILNCWTNEDRQAANYRDIFPDPPKENEVLNCAEGGVLGVLPGIIGTMMANETIKLITGIGEPLINQLVTYNALNNQLYKLKLPVRKEVHPAIPLTESDFLKMDYDWLCSSGTNSLEIDSDYFNELIEKGSVDILDVRELQELPEANHFSNIQIPLAQLRENIDLIKADTVVTFCNTGKRSRQAAKMLSGMFGDKKKVYSLRGGLIELKNLQHTV